MSEVKLTRGGTNKYLRKNSDAPQWIPCSERLPDKDGHYLVSGHTELAGDWAGCDYFEDGIWFEYDVIAWQYLPEPYVEHKEAK